jgi:ferredoxin--NADP+ reductase
MKNEAPMNEIGTESNPLRVAIIGSGPTGFYTADHLFRNKQLVIEVDLYDRLPTPFGLVRFGVAPDHQKIKSVTKAYDRIASHSRFRFYGYVEYGKDVFFDDLEKHYHQIVFTTGAQTDRRLNIPGIDLRNSHPATEFVAWYNGHPDFRECKFDLSQERAAVIGVGNVAVDVARILCRTVDELMETDIADYALEALRESKIREVYIVGRRGPAQAKFTNPELRELKKLADCDLIIMPEEATLDPLSLESLEKSDDRAEQNKVKMIQDIAVREPDGKSRKLMIRFLQSPTELVGDEAGRVVKMRLVKNELYATDAGTLRPRATEQTEELEVGLVFRSIGYHGVPLPGVPFNDSWGVILNQKGRVLDPDTNEPIVGLYTGGWIKRGPTGVIGTNKPDAGETVSCMLEDLAAGRILIPDEPDVEAAQAMVQEKQPRYVSYDDWLRLNELELERGTAQGRPRVKFTSVEEIMEVLGRA